MTPIPLGLIASAIKSVYNYWMSALGGNTPSSQYAYGGAISSTNDVYMVGASENQAFIAKYSATGTLEWQKKLGGGSAEVFYQSTVDSADNVYAIGYTNSTGAGAVDLLLAKYNPAGTIQWQRVLGGTGSEYGYSVAIDSSDNIYLAGMTSSAGPGGLDGMLVKLNSAGTVLWQQALGSSQGSGDRLTGIAFDSLDNVYVVGRTELLGYPNYSLIVAKYNSSGTIQWQRSLANVGRTAGNGIAVDSNDNIYVCGEYDESGSSNNGYLQALLAKYNSSGTLVWQRALQRSGSTSYDEYGKYVTIDSDNNIYITGSTGAGNWDFYVAKYNTSGNLLWQNTLVGTRSEVFNWIGVDSDNNLCLTGYTGSTSGYTSSCPLILKVPRDGSGAGTYTIGTLYPSNLTYGTGPLNSFDPALPSATGSLTAQAISLTSTVVSLPDTVSSMSYEFKGIA